jgi:quinol monooxygenase YgiN
MTKPSLFLKLAANVIAVCIYGFTTAHWKPLASKTASARSSASSFTPVTHTKEGTTHTSGRLRMYVVSETKLAAFRKEVDSYVRKVLQNKDNIMAEGYYEQGNPNVIWIIERWSTDKAFETVKNSVPGSSLTRAANAVQSKQEFEVRDLEPLTKAAWRKEPNTSDSAFTAMLFVNAKPGTGREFRNRYHLAMPQFRAEAGVVTYQLSQLKDSDTRFVTYEKFRSNSAFQYHIKFPPVEPIMDFLHTSITDPPFEKNLHKLIPFTPFTYQ